MSDREEKTKSVLELIKLTEEYFEKKGIESPRVDAEILLGHILQAKRLELYMMHDRPLETEELDRFRELVGKRGQGIPVQHLTGEQEFYALKMQVGQKALIPRQETEVLVERCFDFVKKEGDEMPLRVLELGVGTGAISIALAKGWPKAEFLATDISLDALDIAKGNATYHEVSERIRFVQADMLLKEYLNEPPFDLIVSNPPYIETGEMQQLPKDVREHEPHLALDGGEDGLRFIRSIIDGAKSALIAGGALFMEIGANQGRGALAVIEAETWCENAEILQDYAGRDRILYASKK